MHADLIRILTFALGILNTHIYEQWKDTFNFYMKMLFSIAAEKGVEFHGIIYLSHGS